MAENYTSLRVDNVDYNEFGKWFSKEFADDFVVINIKENLFHNGIEEEIEGPYGRFNIIEYLTKLSKTIAQQFTGINFKGNTIAMWDHCRYIVEFSCDGKEIEIITNVENWENCGLEEEPEQETFTDRFAVDSCVSKEDDLAEQSWKWDEVEDDTIRVIEYIGTDTDVVIPSQINGKDVTVIGKKAFKKGQNIASLTIPYGVEIIEKGAFSCFYKLEKFIVDDKNKKYVLDKHGMLIDQINNILVCCPANGRVKNYTVPNGIKQIGDYAFNISRKLKKISMNDNVEKIGERAFAASDLEVVELSNKITVIEKEAFYACYKLKSVLLPDNLKEIKPRAFEYCKSLEKIELPSKLKKIGKCAFANCINLSQIVIPEGVKKIQDETFMACNNLSLIDLPFGLLEIGKNAFSAGEECVIMFPTTIEKIGSTIGWLSEEEMTKLTSRVKEHIDAGKEHEKIGFKIVGESYLKKLVWC